MTQKTTSEKMIDLNIKEVVFTIKIFDLDAEVFAKKAMIALVFEIDDGSINMAMALIN